MINSSPKTGSREDKSDAKGRDVVAAPQSESKSSGVRKESSSKDTTESDNNTDPKVTSKADSKDPPKPRASSKDDVAGMSPSTAHNRDDPSSTPVKPGAAAASTADSPAKPRFRSSANKTNMPATSPETAQPTKSENVEPEAVSSLNAKTSEAPAQAASPSTTGAAAPASGAASEEAPQASTAQDAPTVSTEAPQQKKGFLSGMSSAVGNFISYKSKKSPKEGANPPSSPPDKGKVASPSSVPDDGKPAASGTAAAPAPTQPATASAGTGKGPSPEKAGPVAAPSASTAAAAPGAKSPETTKGASSTSPPENKKPAVVVPPLQLGGASSGAAKPDEPAVAAPAAIVLKEAVGSPPVDDRKKATPEKTEAPSSTSAPVASKEAPSAATSSSFNEPQGSAAAPIVAAPAAAAGKVLTGPSRSATASPVVSDSEQPPAAGGSKKAPADKPWLNKSNSRKKMSPSTVPDDVVVVASKSSPQVTVKKTESAASTSEAPTATTASVEAKKSSAEPAPSTATAGPAPVSAPEQPKPEDKPVGIADPKAAKTASPPEKKAAAAPAATPAKGDVPTAAAVAASSGAPPVNEAKLVAGGGKTASPETKPAAPLTTAAADPKEPQPQAATGTSEVAPAKETGENEKGTSVAGREAHHTTHVETTSAVEVDEAANILLSGSKHLRSPRSEAAASEDEKKDDHAASTGGAAAAPVATAGAEHHSFFDNDEAKQDDPASAAAAALVGKHKTNLDHARDIDHPLLRDSKESERKDVAPDGLEIRRTKNESVFESWDNAAETSIYRHVDAAVPKIREQFDYSLPDGKKTIFRRNRQKAQHTGDLGGKPLPVVKTPDQSALKIQSVFRGKKVRKHRRLQIAAVTCIQRMYRGVLSRKKFVNDVLAMKIKARAEKERKKRLMAIKSKERDMMLLNSIPAEEYLNYERIKKNNSAKVIQKNWRAKYTAMTGKAPPSLASVVQRATAGMTAHRYPQDLHKKRVTPLKEGGTRSVITGLKEEEAAKAKRNDEKEQILMQQRQKMFEYMKRMRGTEDILVARAVEQNIPYVPHTVEAVYSPDVDAIGLAQLHRKIKDAAQQKSKEREQRADRLGFRHRAGRPADPSFGGMSEDENADSNRNSARTQHREEVLQHQKAMNDRGGARRKYQDLREAQQRASILMQEYSYAQPAMQARQVARQQTLGNCQYLLDVLKNPPSLDDAKSFIQALEKEQSSGMHSSNLQASLSAVKPTAAEAKAERERLDQAHKWFHDDVVDYSFFQHYQKSHALEKAAEAGKDTAPIEARFGETQLEKVVETHLRTLAAVKDKNNWGVVAIPLNVALPDAVVPPPQPDEPVEVQVNVSLNRSTDGFPNALTSAKSTKNALKRETKVFRHLDSNWVKGTDAEDSLYWISYATQPSKVTVSSLTPSDVVTARQKQVIVANKKGGVTTEAPVPTSDTPKPEEAPLAPTSLQLLEKHAELLKEVSVEAMNHPKRKQNISKYCKTENEKINRLAGVFQQEAVSLIKREYSIKSGRIASKEQRQQQMKAVVLIQSLFRGKRARKKAAAVRTQQRVLAALQNLLQEISNSDTSKQKHHAAHHATPGPRYGPAAVSESMDHTGPIMDYVSKIPHLQGLLATPGGGVYPQQQPPHSATFSGKESVQSANRFAKVATASEPVESSIRSPYVKSTYNLQPVATPATPHLMEHFQSVPNTGATPIVASHSNASVVGSSILKNAWAPPTPSTRSSNLAAASVGINFVDGGTLSRVPSTDRDLRSSIGTPRVGGGYGGQYTPRTGGGGLVPDDLALRLPPGHGQASTTVGSIVPMSPYTPTVPDGSKPGAKSRLSPRANNTIPSGNQLRRSEEAESPRDPMTPRTPGDDKSMLSEFSYSEPQTGYISSPSQSHSSLSHSNSLSVSNNKLVGKRGGSSNRLSKHSEEDAHALDDDDDEHEFLATSLSSRFSPYKNSPRKTDPSEGKGGDDGKTGEPSGVKRKFQIGSQSSAKVAQTMFMVEQQFKNKTTAVNSFIQSALVSQIANFDRHHAIQMMTDIARVTGIAPLSQWLYLFKQSVAASSVAAGATPASSTEVKSNEMPVETGAVLLSSLASEFGLMGSKDGPQSEKALFSIIQMCMLLRLLGSGNDSGNLKISEVTSIVEDVWLQDARNQGNSSAGVKLMWQLAQLRANVLQQATKKGGMNPRKMLEETIGIILASAGNPDNLKSTVGGTLTVTDALELDKKTLVQLVHQFASTEDNDATLELVDNLIKLCKWTDKVTAQSTVTVLELKELLCTLCSYRSIQKRVELWFRAVPTMHQSLLDAVHSLTPAKESLVSMEVFCQACEMSNIPLSFSESFMLAQLLTRKTKAGLLGGVGNALKSITGSGGKNVDSARSSVSSSYNREGWHVDISLLQKIKNGERLNAVMM